VVHSQCHQYYERIIFIDDDPSREGCYPPSELPLFPPEEYCMMHGIGNCEVRAALQEKHLNYAWETMVSDRAYIHSSAEIGRGSQILVFSSILPSVKIGKGVIINNHANVDHDCDIGNYSHIAPGAVLCGRVSIGKRTLIGAGAVIVPGVGIGDDCVVTAGSKVKTSMPDGTILTWSGEIKENNALG